MLTRRQKKPNCLQQLSLNYQLLTVSLQAEAVSAYEKGHVGLPHPLGPKNTRSKAFKAFIAV